MPNRDFHVSLGSAAGVVASVVSALQAPPSSARLVTESIGGLIGGYCGARLPDILDPPTLLGPHHRGFAHGVLPVGSGIAWLVKNSARFQAEMRRRALEFEYAGDHLIAFFCRLIAGAIPGIAAGYVSHLLADSQTPAGLPLFA